MNINDLKIPSRLIELINDGVCPSTYSDIKKQNLEPLFSEEQVKNINPEMSTIFFESPPFISMERLKTINENEEFWPYENVESINLSRALLIGDFGIGSESVLILYYEEYRNEPSVWMLVWYLESGSTLNCRWTKVTDSFVEFW
ncbi:MAG: hypothetical protein ACPGVO_13690, partial [Spirulinaceae cyanobacterium]